MPLALPCNIGSIDQATDLKRQESYHTCEVRFVEIKKNKTGNRLVDDTVNQVLNAFIKTSVETDIALNIAGINLLNRNEINTFLEKKLDLSRVIRKVKEKIETVYNGKGRLAGINLELTEDPEFKEVYTLYLTVSNTSDDIDIILDDFDLLMPDISYGELSDQMGSSIVVGVV